MITKQNTLAFIQNTVVPFEACKKMSKLKFAA